MVVVLPFKISATLAKIESIDLLWLTASIWAMIPILRVLDTLVSPSFEVFANARLTAALNTRMDVRDATQ